MRVKQIILFIAGIIVVALLYQFAVTKPEPKSGEAAAPMMAAGSGAAAASVDFNNILAKAKATLDDARRNEIESLELEMKKAHGDQDKANLLQALADKWDSSGNILVAGKLYAEAAGITHDKNLLDRAASLFYSGFPTTTDSLARIFGAQEGVKAFQQLAVMDSTNMTYPVHEAICYVDGLGQVMQGVLLLKGVEQKDPDNVEMNLVLGRLAIVSGQYDKAMSRLEKLTAQHPDNAEAFFHLAEAYRAVGRKEDAIKSLEQCKTLVNNPDFSAQIDTYIQQIQNP